jgi:hypothetical protein
MKFCNLQISLFTWAHLSKSVLLTCFLLISSGESFGKGDLPSSISSSLVPAQSKSIIARSGEVISGQRISNPNGPCIVLKNVVGVSILNNDIGPCGTDPRYEVGIAIDNSSDVQIVSNRFHEVSSALYAVNGTQGKLLFEANEATQIRGPAPRGQLVQLNNYSGPNLVIRCNISDQAIGGYLNKDGGGGPEDHINIYKSSGTPTSPIQILHNKVRGGGSKSGGGIMAVDGGGGANVLIENNILVDAGQYGIGIPSGENVLVRRNQVYSSKHSWNNVGIYLWNQYAGTQCSNTEVSDNRVSYVNPQGRPNPYWNSGSCGTVKTPQPNQLNDQSMSPAIWNTSLAACKQSWRAR